MKIKREVVCSKIGISLRFDRGNSRVPDQTVLVVAIHTDTLLQLFFVGIDIEMALRT